MNIFEPEKYYVRPFYRALWSFLLLGVGNNFIQAAVPSKSVVTYEEHVLPLFRNHCTNCHNSDKARGDLDVSSYQALLQGGSSGEVLISGDPDGSKLFKVMAHLEEPVMPPKNPRLPQKELEVVRAWIAGGLLENSTGKAKPVRKPKVELAVNTTIARPQGPPVMPENLSLEPVVKMVRANPVHALATAPWAPLLAVGAAKQILLYHSETTEPLGVLPFPEGFPHVVRFSRNGTLLMAGGGRGGQSGKVAIWNVRTGARVTEVGGEFDSVLAADISADQTRVALGGPSKLVKVYSTADGQALLSLKKHTDWVTAISFSPDGGLFVSGDRNGGLIVWESDSGQEVSAPRGHTAMVTALAWRDDGRFFASASEDGTVRLWDATRGVQIRATTAHPGGAMDVAFSHDGSMASCGRDKTVKIWDRNGAIIKTLEPFSDLALRVGWNHDGKRVIGGDFTGTLRGWNPADGKRQSEWLALPASPEVFAEQARQRVLILEKSVAELAKVADNSKMEVEKLRAALLKEEREIRASLTAAETRLAKAKQAAKPGAAGKNERDQAAQAVQSARVLKARFDKSAPQRQTRLATAAEAAKQAATRLAQVLAELDAARATASRWTARLQAQR